MWYELLVNLGLVFGTLAYIVCWAGLIWVSGIVMFSETKPLWLKILGGTGAVVLFLAFFAVTMTFSNHIK